MPEAGRLENGSVVPSNVCALGRERQRLEGQARVIEQNIERQLQGVNAALA